MIKFREGGNERGMGWGGHSPSSCCSRFAISSRRAGRTWPPCSYPSGPVHPATTREVHETAFICNQYLYLYRFKQIDKGKDLICQTSTNGTVNGQTVRQNLLQHIGNSDIKTRASNKMINRV